MLFYIDFLKFIAIFAVIAFHVHDTITFDTPWFTGGYLGVDVFLFLSGFLIERSLKKNAGNSWAQQATDFLFRRFSRILIPVLAITFSVALFSQFSGAVPSPWDSAFWSAILGYNFYLVFHNIPYFQIYSTPHPFLGMWFIALLGQLYIAHFLLRSLLPWRWPYRIILVLLLFLTFLLAIYWVSQGQPNQAYVLPSHAFPYLAGILVEALGWSGSKKEEKGRLVFDFLAIVGTVIAFGVFLIAPWESFIWYSAGMTLLIGFVVFTATRGIFLVHLNLPLLGAMGEMSYSLYLWNVPVIAFVHFYFHAAPQQVQTVTSVSLILVLAIISYLMLEVPIQSFFGRRMRYVFSPLAYGSVLALLIVSGCGWLEASQAWVAWSEAHARNQHDALYRQYLDHRVQQLSSELKSITRSSSLQAAEIRVDNQISAQREASRETAIFQWQPKPAFTYLYDGNGRRQNHAYLQKSVLFITDSILLGWSGYVIHMVPDGMLDGQVGRSFFGALPTLNKLLSDPENNNAKYLVIELGSNGYVQTNTLEQFLQAAGDRKILLIIPAVPRPWENEVRETYLRIAMEFPNVTLLHWDALSQDHPGYFVQDQVHLTWDGAQALMQAILQQLYVMGYRNPGATSAPVSDGKTPVALLSAAETGTSKQLQVHSSGIVGAPKTASASSSQPTMAMQPTTSLPLQNEHTATASSQPTMGAGSSRSTR